jgi:ferric-dicitrate binding protein FerR (iron transport regulator)
VDGQSVLNSPTGLPELLVAGEHVRILRNGSGRQIAPETLSPERMNDALAWRSRRLVFHGDRLGDIVDQFNRFNGHRLVLDGVALSERRFGGTFPAGDYESLVRTLEHDYGIAGERLAQVTRLHWAPGTAPVLAEPRLVFKSERLRDIVAEFNRHNRHQLVIDSPELAELRFGGTFPASDIETFVAMLEQNFAVIAVRGPAETRLRSAGQNSAAQKFP